MGNYEVANSVLCSVLFVETGCIINSNELKRKHKERIEFLLYGEEVGDFTIEQFREGMRRVCNDIFIDNGMIEHPYTPDMIKKHTKDFMFRTVVQAN